MRQLIRTVLALVSMVFVFDCARGDVKVGDQMPDFDLAGSDGKYHSAREMEGKTAYVIAWFPRAFTGGCTKECKSMKEFGDELRKFEVAYFTASVDSVKKNKDFSKSLELDYPILSDPDKELSMKLGCLNDRGFTNRWTYYVGKDGKILHIDRSVKTTSHGEDVAKKLGEMGIQRRR